MNAAHDSFWFDEQGSKSLESVSLVLPGPVATRFREHALAALQPLIGWASAVHREKYKAMEAALAPGARIKPFTASALDVAEKIYRAAEVGRPKPRYLVTPQTYIAEFVTRFMPHSVQRRILRQLCILRLLFATAPVITYESFRTQSVELSLNVTLIGPLPS